MGQWLGARLERHAGREVRRYDTDWHFHRDWQVIHVTDGRRAFEWRGGGLTFGPKQTLILPPGLVHRGHSTSEVSSFVMLYASSDSLGISAPSSPTIVHDRKLTAAIIEVDTEHTREEKREEIESILARVVSRGATTTWVPPVVSCVRAWLEEHHDSQCSFEELGRVRGCNPFYMSHLFRQWVGLSPRAFRVQLRLLEARRRIALGQPLASVAADLGFADQSHLGRQFKRAFGLPPGLMAGLITGL